MQFSNPKVVWKDLMIALRAGKEVDTKLYNIHVVYIVECHLDWQIYSLLDSSS